jgi:uncharacterized membrane protein
MFDAFYSFLDKIGYLHPIHPAMTHMPIGLVVGSLFLGVTALFYSRTSMARAAYYTLVLALVFWVPTVAFGLMDWQRYFAGALLFPIKMKLILASVLFVLLATGALIGWHRAPARVPWLVGIYFLSFMTVTGLGYFGGQLVYGGRTPSGPAEFRAGEHIFDSHCSGCHAHGGNTILPNFPLRSAPELAKFQEFLSFVRNPGLPSGARGPMPPFPPSRLSDKQAHELYEYITNVIEKPSRK